MVADIDIRLIERIVLSTTLTTNAIIQKKTPIVGMLVSSGPEINAEAYRTGEFCYSIAPVALITGAGKWPPSTPRRCTGPRGISCRKAFVMWGW